MSSLLTGEYRALPKRKLTEETCAKFGYSVATHKGETVQVANYRDQDGDLVAQKVRTASKDFSTLGDFSEVALFGAHLWSGGGRKIVVTEGEIDCLTVSQAQNNKWPVVSVPNGASAALKAIKRNLSFLEKFEEVIFMFDQDDPGIAAAKECAAILPVGRAKIATLALKDPSELMKAGRQDEIVSAIWNAKEYRPDGLLSFEDVIERIKKPVEMGLPWWDDRLTAATYGRRYKEVYTFGAGTGIGKTDWLTQQIAFDMAQGIRVGLVFLETPVDELGKRIAGKYMGKLFHVPDAEWTQEELDQGSEWLIGKGCVYDSFGQTDWDVVKGHIRYMATALDIKVFYLDHLTALADTTDEKGSLEQIMKELAGLVHELGLILHLVSHLTTPEGKPHEEGGRVMIRHFKGSRSIGFWSNFMFGLERNQQTEDESERGVSLFRVLKDRNTGRSTGKTLGLLYSHGDGRLAPHEQFADSPFKNETAPDF
ncbi:MAG: toprim domain-containing protein [Proteobacteria bacterium]|nr:toprim domain-containing protein [Pseudomonadota bacterium]